MDPSQALERARARDPGADPMQHAAMRRAVEASVAYLGSEQARCDLDLDPYWPKWTSPWWHMIGLHELGLHALIPDGVVRHMARRFDAHFLRDFPFRLEDVPAGLDPYRHIVCHCALGAMARVLFDCGVDVDRELPWLREWIFRYLLPDGGLNCDEAAYLRPTPRSSMASTLPPAEAILFATARPLDSRERGFLGGVARYLEARALVRSLSKQRVIDPAWLVPCSPRLYFYDVMRGLRFLAGWREHGGAPIALAAVGDTIAAVDAWFESAAPPREPHREMGSYSPDAAGRWRRGERAQPCALLDAIGSSGAGRALLAREWLGSLERLAAPGAVV